MRVVDSFMIARRSSCNTGYEIIRVEETQTGIFFLKNEMNNSYSQIDDKIVKLGKELINKFFGSKDE